MTKPTQVLCKEPKCRQWAKPVAQDGRGRTFYACPNGHSWRSDPWPENKESKP